MLFKKNGKFTDLKKDLQEDVDYLQFSKLAFDQLKGWYGVDYEAYGTLKFIEHELELDLTEKMNPATTNKKLNSNTKEISHGLKNLKFSDDILVKSCQVNTRKSSKTSKKSCI